MSDTLTTKDLETAIEEVVGRIHRHAGNSRRSASWLRKLLHTHLDPLVAEAERFAQVAWSVGDITDVYEVTDQQAIELLFNFARDIQEQMVERGWDVIDSLANARGYQRRD